MLTAVQVKGVKEPGRYGDGGGLYLVVRRGGSKAWVQRIVVDGRRRDIGLGGWPKVTLAEARRRAADNHDAIAGGRNPVAEKRRPKLPTFRAAADACYNAHRPRWRSEKVAKNWKQRLEKHAMPKLGSLPIDRITRQDVLAVLVPIWGRTPETARTVRSYMRAVFRWAQAMGYRDDNPAGEGIDGALPRLPARRSHFRALPHAEVADALRVIDESKAGLSAKLALRFTVLTAVRSGETRGATWSEIDLEASIWTIPAERMKGGAEHRVPLSDAAMDVLAQAWALREDDGGLVFPGRTAGRQLSDMTMTKVLRTTGLAERATVHGFRSSFRDWAAERTSASHAAMELSLAHHVGNAVERAYARSDLLEQRRALVEAWADYITLPSQTAAAA